MTNNLGGTVPDMFPTDLPRDKSHDAIWELLPDKLPTDGNSPSLSLKKRLIIREYSPLI
jgi:hypothetical protein